jgi:hypothetical protein
VSIRGRAVLAVQVVAAIKQAYARSKARAYDH